MLDTNVITFLFLLQD